MMSYMAHAEDLESDNNSRTNIINGPQPQFQCIDIDTVDGVTRSDAITLDIEKDGKDDVNDLLLNHEKNGRRPEIDQVDNSSGKTKNLYASKKNVAEGMMDIALLTANANQLRFLITYNTESKTYYVSLVLIVLSLVLQISVGIALIFKRQMKNKGKRNKADSTNDYLVVGVFLVTVINVFVASFTITDSVK